MWVLEIKTSVSRILYKVEIFDTDSECWNSCIAVIGAGLSTEYYPLENHASTKDTGEFAREVEYLKKLLIRFIMVLQTRLC